MGNKNDLKFPSGFLIGTASSAYQIEGAWNSYGKGENIWDKAIHSKPEKVHDKTNADVACDSYHFYKKDVELIHEIGFDFYRFSIAWSRILPTGEAHIVNDLGVQYYNNLINELLDKGVIPMVTMYHFDLPQRLQDLGGWTNPLITGYFEDYARLLYQLFGDRVKWWVTVNEPELVAVGYGNGSMAPCVNLFGYGEYLVAHNLLVAHAKAFRAYDSEFRPTQQGKVTIAINSMYHWPKTDSSEDKEAAERAMQFQLGLFADPIFGQTGEYPPAVREYIDRASKQEGRSQSKLPKFTKEEIALIKGSCDFFGFQYYTSSQVFNDPDGEPESWYTHKDVHFKYHSPSTWKASGIPWLKVVPEGIRMVLNYIKTRYGNPEVFITECGYGDFEENDPLEDTNRIHYFHSHLREVLRAIHEDGCSIIGFAAWSLLDNFEWFEGLKSKFGLVKVDFQSLDKKRTPKKSAKFFKQILQERAISQED